MADLATSVNLVMSLINSALKRNIFLIAFLIVDGSRQKSRYLGNINEDEYTRMHKSFFFVLN